MKNIIFLVLGFLLAAGITTAAGLHDWSTQEATVGIMVPHAGYNPSTTIAYNAAGEVVYVDETYVGDTFRQTLNRSDMTVTSTLTIDTWSKQ